MIARFHYDKTMYQRFLNDELQATEQQKVETHVESCTRCQDELEDMLDDDTSWNDIPALLQQDTRADDSNRSTPTRYDFLGPSDTGALGRFGRYEIVEVLGRGGMGIVFKGFDQALNRYSAVKVLAPHLAANAAARRRFAREAKSAAAVVNEYVVPIQTVDEERGLPYLVMPVVDGQSLQERVEKQGPLETKEVLRIGLQIAQGLAAAHAQGLVHRDIKPANVLLENKVERVMLTDFGLARAVDDANMTQSGTLAGTPQYMSPEQAKGEDIDARSDLFSLGSVLYFMCTGRSPFRAQTTMGILHRINNETPRSLRAVNSDVPEWLESIVKRMLSKRPQDRFQNAQEVADILSAWLAHLQQPDAVERPAITRVPHARSNWSVPVSPPTILAGVAGAFALFAGIMITLEWNKGTLTIECAEDDVPVRIIKGDRVYKRLEVDRGVSTTRIAAGKYIVELDTKVDDLVVKDGAIELSRGGGAIAKIVESPPPKRVPEDTDTELAGPAEGTTRTTIQKGIKNEGGFLGPVRMEFLEGTDVFVVRGKKPDVERAMKIIDKIKEVDQETKAAKTEKLEDAIELHRGNFSHHIARPEVLKAKAGARSIWLEGTSIESKHIAYLKDAPIESLGIHLTELLGESLGRIPEWTQLRELTLAGPGVNDAWIRNLPKMPQLRFLNIIGGDISGKTLHVLPEHLENLWLQHVKLDHGLQFLDKLPNLQSLGLRDMTITDDDLQHVGQLSKLESFSIGSPRLNGHGLKHLLELASLDDLSLNGPGVTDQWIEAIEPLRGVTWLQIHNSQVTDAGIASIANWSKLKHLYLNRNRHITDASIGHLQNLFHLQVAEFWDTQVTGKGAAKLKEALRDVSVSFGETDRLKGKAQLPNRTSEVEASFQRQSNLPPEFHRFDREKTFRSVVNIRSSKPSEGTNEPINLFGAGVIVDPHGYILTSSHLVENADRIQVTMGEQTFAGSLVVLDQNHHIAVIRVQRDKPFHAIPLPDAKARVGDRVIAIGNSFGMEHTLSLGLVSAVGRTVTVSPKRVYSDLIQTDVAASPANVGGPLVDVNGAFLGVITPIRRSSQGVCFAIPADAAIESVQKFILHEGVSTNEDTALSHLDFRESAN